MSHHLPSHSPSSHFSLAHGKVTPAAAPDIGHDPEPSLPEATPGMSGSISRHVLAAGEFGHNVWDVVHHPIKRFVPQRQTEASVALHVLGAAAFLLLA